MNADRLLEHYDRIADAPDAIVRLRRFILDLAVRGKLVPQDASDEPASELLKRIAKEKARLVEAKAATLSRVDHNSDNDQLFLIPNGWVWTSLGSVSTVTMGQSPPGVTYNTTGEGVPLINGPVEFTPGPFGKTVINQFTTAPTNFCEAGDLLICVRGSTTGRTNVAAFRACIGRGVAAIRSSFDDSFVRLFIWKARYDIIEMGRGIAFPNVTRKQIEDLAFPLPPLAEQHRIVAKVDALMALCDRLEAAQVSREGLRDRLAAASLARLNSPDPETFQADARFVLDALPAFTTRPDQIKALRQTILNLAVRGKHVTQDANDEPVSKRYQKELGGEDIPTSWRVLNFGKFCDIEGGNQPPKSQFIDEPRKGYVRLLQIRDLGDRPVPVYIPIASARSLCKEGEILIGRYGASVGKVFWAQDGAYNVAMAKFIWPDDAVIPRFAFLLLKSEFLQAPLTQVTRSAQAGFNKGDLAPIDFPLPPLAEQHRIVVKVDELMALCDRLEASLTATAATRRRLLDALLAEALVPVDARERVAAE